ncbi:isocitrate lyase/phosphoenolpyruvate mutase family protein [Nonomuraea aridisoli]|uniref:isocitrate lyase/phosphoenolpyruvate mutase family protein n=1 Tax=Nonomuraea aridisoli TaxID=2070368 RepID=UPI0034DD6E11
MHGTAHPRRWLVMPNAWDGLPALMPADPGFEAIATSSAALAAMLGRSDLTHSSRSSPPSRCRRTRY